MNHFVTDASIAIKWLVQEAGTVEALTILETAKLSARLLEQADIEILPTRHLLDSATSHAVELDRESPR